MMRFIETHGYATLATFFGVTAALSFVEDHWVTGGLNVVPFTFFTYRALKGYT